DTSALVMSVAAAERWQLDIDVGAGWRIVSVAVAPRAARDLAAHLRRGGRWDLVDDRRQQDGAASETRVVLEVA
ncbi:MAG: hypothetical protein M3N47_08770, partial [Chloroflexota bacterium]|nr:hypothetical protein [Chloroflexota bacterium]